MPDPNLSPESPSNHINPMSHGARHNARRGVWLFLVYLVFYGSFVALSVFAPKLMADTPFAGVSLAIIYGFGLIGSALLLAIIYMLGCKPTDAEDGK